MNPVFKWYRWVKGLWRKPVETDEAWKYRIYFSEKLLKHQIDKLPLYDPEYVAQIPKDPEVLKHIFPK